MLTIPKEQCIAEALTRHIAGESLREIAPTYAISHTTLRAMLLGEVPEKYREAQQASFIRRIAEADEMLEGATDSVSVSKYREIARFARWDAERRLPNLFGQRQEVHHVHDLSDDLRAISERRKARALIESTAHIQPTEAEPGDARLN